MALNFRTNLVSERPCYRFSAFIERRGVSTMRIVWIVRTLFEGRLLPSRNPVTLRKRG